ncbi:hypothetical protein ABRP58_14800 [Pectobacterium aroidearum]|uniref:hypothetical protein n=1 Tax=Pectobacterium aroidearum TaxID=1201031 RepID=UPI0032EE7F35
MKDNNKEEIINPAVKVEGLISQLDKILGVSGGLQIRQPITAAKREKFTSLSDYLAVVFETISFIPLQQKYTEILEIVAEIIANIEEDPYFENISPPSLPEVGSNETNNIKEFIRYVVLIKEAIQPLIENEINLSKKNQFLSAINNKKRILEKGFFYEFTDGDLKRIRLIINELRECISDSELFEDNHRSRLLKRLEALQSEMHKKMGDIDRIWGLVGDAGVVIGKFGKDAKPFVDRIKELSQIAWKTQARAEELPSSSINPLLERKNGDT